MKAASTISRLLSPRRAESSILDELPDDARELYERGSCTLVEACHFLGWPTKRDSRDRGREQSGSAASARAKRYVKRMDRDLYVDRRVPGLPHPLRVERVLDVETKAQIRRPRFERGGYCELPCSRPDGGAYEVDTNYLIPMRFEEVPWPAK